jgi:CheY-like chemotaxis protein
LAKKKILFVDDQENLLELVRGVLEPEGYEVITVNSGMKALEKLKKVRPDLILMDVMMPGMTGKETVKKIRQDPEMADVKIAFLTVTRSVGFEAKALRELGIADYITKPFDSDDLVVRVKKMLDD